MQPFPRMIDMEVINGAYITTVLCFRRVPESTRGTNMWRPSPDNKHPTLAAIRLVYDVLVILTEPPNPTSSSGSMMKSSNAFHSMDSGYFKYFSFQSRLKIIFCPRGAIRKSSVIGLRECFFWIFIKMKRRFLEICFREEMRNRYDDEKVACQVPLSG